MKLTQTIGNAILLLMLRTPRAIAIPFERRLFQFCGWLARQKR